MLLKLDILRQQTVLSGLETAPARIAKKPKRIARSLSIFGTQRRLAQRRLENLLRFARVAQHQETKAIKLRKILFWFGHADFFPKAATLRAAFARTRNDSVCSHCSLSPSSQHPDPPLPKEAPARQAERGGLYL